MKNTIGRTNNGNTPILAILICSVFGFLAFLGLEDTEGSTFNQVSPRSSHRSFASYRLTQSLRSPF